ncbi:hypothetical protein MTO96_004075 [Rhipicephalus appendiculatus]
MRERKLLDVRRLLNQNPPSVTVLGASVGLVDGAHWKQPLWMGRAFFSLLSDPPALLLNRLNLSDTGGYVCNVSYRGDNVTDAGVIVTEAAVELFIAVPQQPPVIRDSQGNLLLATAGPYAEGDTVRLTCAVPADSPRCVSDEDLTLSVETDEAVNLTCHVRADPSEGLRYFWLAENSTHGTEATLRSPPYRRQQLPLPHVTESNRLEIVANASIFDTVLACWAENAVGTQERRCRFTFVRKGVNTPTLRCSVGNYTDSSFILTCFTPLANVTKTSSTKLRQEQRLRVQVFDARRGNRSERSFWSTDLGPILVNRLRSATDYLVVVRMPPDASFQTYTSRGTHVGGRWTLALSVVVLACSLAVTLTALFAIYCAHVRKKKMKRRRKPLDKDCKSDASSSSREDVDSVHIRDHKEYLAAMDTC